MTSRHRNADATTGPVCERLEPRLQFSSAYDLAIVATTGSGLGLTGLGTGPSINDQGYIAFSAESNNSAGRPADNIYAYNPATGGIAALMDRQYMYPKAAGEVPGQTIAPDVQINNSNEVLARRRLATQATVTGVVGYPVLTYLETWSASGAGATGLPTSRVAMGDGGAGGASAVILFHQPAGDLFGSDFPIAYERGSPFFGIYPYASQNNVGQYAFGTINSNLVGGGNSLVTSPHPERPHFGISVPAGFQARPMMADTGELVVRGTRGQVALASFDLGTVAELAGSATGFSSIGENPGISDDGRVVAFVGTLSDAGAAAINASQAGLGLQLQPVTPGPGVYVSVAAAPGPVSSVRYIQKAAGIAGNSILDPGEGFTDANANGVFEPGAGDVDYTTENPVSGLDASARVGVSRLGTSGEYQIVYLGSGDQAVGAPETLYATYFRPAAAGNTFTASAPTTVARRGEVVSGQGRIADIAIHDPLNASGEVAFWAALDGGTQAIIRARPRTTNIRVLRVQALDPTNVRIKYVIEGSALDAPFAVDLFYSSTDDFDRPATFQTRRVGPQQRVFTVPSFDDRGLSSTSVGEHEVTFPLGALAGLGSSLVPTRTLRYMYADIDPLNEIREAGVGPLGTVNDLAGRSSRNDNVGRLGYVPVEDLRTLMPALAPADAQRYVVPLNNAMSEFFIFTAERQAAFLAQIKAESDQLRDWDEDPSTIPPSTAVGTRLPDGFVVTSIGMRRGVIVSYRAEKVHANGSVEKTRRFVSGPNYEAYDNPAHHGRGPIQITSTANYRDVGNIIGVDIEARPELVDDTSNPIVGFRAAAAFWRMRGLNTTADRVDPRRVASITAVNTLITVGVRGSGGADDVRNLRKRNGFFMEALLLLTGVRPR